MNKKSLRISFEFYPPKSQAGSEQLMRAATELKTVSPDFFSVTFGAGGSTRDGTFQVVNTLMQESEVEIAPHISCVGLDEKTIVTIVNEYQALGIKRIISLRGDLPSGMVSTGEFQYAHELVKLIRKIAGNHFEIEVAAYPECHPQAKTILSDVENLKRKQDAGANNAITQYFFNADAYFYLLDECAKQDVTMPIYPGIMPILQFSKLVRFSNMCGAEIPRWLSKRLEAYGDDIESIKAFGIQMVSNLCEQLIEAGAPGLHFYTLNHAELSLQILENLDLADQQENAEKVKMFA